MDPIIQLHFDPKVWDQTEEFIPERMLNRQSIGQLLAWEESLVSMALIEKSFHMKFVDPSSDLRIEHSSSNTKTNVD